MKKTIGSTTSTIIAEEIVIKNTVSDEEINVQAHNNDNDNDSDTSSLPPSSSSSSSSLTFVFQGKQFTTYEEMVKAKRQRNTDFLRETGLLGASSKLREDVFSMTNKAEPTQRGLHADRKRKMPTERQTTRRKSSRLAGVQADGMYVEDEKGRGRIVIGGTRRNRTDTLGTGDVVGVKIEEEESFFNDRINDGSTLSLKEAVEKSASKWVKENSISLAEEIVSSINYESKRRVKDEYSGSRSPTTITTSTNTSLLSQVESLNVEDETNVAKVVPERIYSIAFHPSPHKLIAVAGDKKGHLGLWDVDAPPSEDSDKKNSTNGVHLFRPHSSVISNLEWDNSGRKLFSSSYDGSMRLFDVEKETFTEIFATYDSSPQYKDKLGFGLYDGWIQYSCLDHRNNNCIFFSTSSGDVCHIDLRQKAKITFNTSLSEKKVNTVRYVFLLFCFILFVMS